jgi:hypothetical protein
MTLTSPPLFRTAIAVAFAVAAAQGSAFAQGNPTSADARWAPWVGCWQLADESVTERDATVGLMPGAEPAQRSRANAGALVCVKPAPAPSTATMTTLVNDREVLTETVVADGSQRPLNEPDCEGWQRAEWSTEGPRLFAKAEIACAGQPKRIISSMAMLIAGPLWVDVQMIESDGRKSLRIRRYQRALDQRRAGDQSAAREAQKTVLSARLSIAAIKEANAKLPSEALQAALLEIRDGFDINGKRLVELSEAGVPGNVIDLMIALTFPDKLVVERQSAGSFSSAGFADYWPWYTDPFFYSSYYSLFGYRSWGYFDPFFSGPGFVVIGPGGGTVGPTEPARSGVGRVVDGQGYTRVTTRAPERTVRDGSGWQGTSSTGGGSSGSSGSSSGGVSSSGYSSGGGSGGGGGERTAVSRPPGK